LVRQHLAGAKVVKGFNHIAAADVTTDGQPSGTPGRRALTTASVFPRPQRSSRNSTISTASTPSTSARSRKAGVPSSAVPPSSPRWTLPTSRPAWPRLPGSCDITQRSVVARPRACRDPQPRRQRTPTERGIDRIQDAGGNAIVTADAGAGRAAPRASPN
jgi:hypothetical protein